MQKAIKLRSVIKFEQLKNFYPIGTILSGLSSAANPNDFIPGTIWERIPDDVYIVTATFANGEIIEETPLTISENNIQAFSPQVSSTSHSHKYNIESFQASGHGPWGGDIIGWDYQDLTVTNLDTSKHTHTITLGNDKPINLNETINHTKMSAWIRIA